MPTKFDFDPKSGQRGRRRQEPPPGAANVRQLPLVERPARRDPPPTQIQPTHTRQERDRDKLPWYSR